MAQLPEAGPWPRVGEPTQTSPADAPISPPLDVPRDLTFDTLQAVHVNQDWQLERGTYAAARWLTEIVIDEADRETGFDRLVSGWRLTVAMAINGSSEAVKGEGLQPFMRQFIWEYAPARSLAADTDNFTIGAFDDLITSGKISRAGLDRHAATIRAPHTYSPFALIPNNGKVARAIRETADDLLPHLRPLALLGERQFTPWYSDRRWRQSAEEIIPFVALNIADIALRAHELDSSLAGVVSAVVSRTKPPSNVVELQRLTGPKSPATAAEAALHGNQSAFSV